MDAVYEAVLTALLQFLVHQAPAWVGGHPKTALAAVTVYAGLEHAWPILKAKGWVRGNSTFSVLIGLLKRRKP